jgi:ABC-type multidrug transport system ATPase subunit
MLDSVTVRFGKKVVLDSFSLSVTPGEKVTLTGRSGAGKSTVLRSILGFVAPAAGTVAVEGEKVTPDSVWRLRHRVAYVAQEPDLGDGTVRELIERPFSYKANSHLRDNLAELDAILDRFFLPRSLLTDEMSTLSGGEKQRVAVICAILLSRRIFLLDEPSSALDGRSREAVAEFFRDRSDLTVLSVAHDVEALAFGGRTVEVPDGGNAP